MKLPTLHFAKKLALLLGAVVWGTVSGGRAQQLPLSVHQLVERDFMNPAAPVLAPVNQLDLAVQQRARQGLGWRSASQFLAYRGRPQGSKEIFRWGLNAIHDIEHTEQRFALAPTVSAEVWANEATQIRLGVQIGFLLWNSNYLGRRIHDLGDPITTANLNLTEVNTGAGVSLQHRGEGFWLDAGLSGTQLSGNLISSPLEGMRLYPHLLAEARLLFLAGENLRIGPRGTYRRLVAEERTFGGGGTDIGVAVQIPERSLSGGIAWRMTDRAVAVGVGFPLVSNLLEARPGDQQQQLKVRFGLLYPLATRQAFGPTVDVGLQWVFGRLRDAEVDTLPFAEVFWQGESAQVAHKEKYLDPAGPVGLTSLAEVFEREVFLTYRWLDRSLLYSGELPRIEGGAIKRVGREWTGIDALVRGIVDHVVEDALYPDSSQVRDPENLEALRHLAWIEVNSDLRFDASDAEFASKMVYQGEFSAFHPGCDSILIAAVVDEKDTVVVIPQHRNLSNLELAALKLFAIRSRVLYELRRRYGEQFRIVDKIAEAESLYEYTEDWRRPIFVKPPRITTDHTNLQAFQANYIVLKFPRRPQNYPGDPDGWIRRKDPEND
ncbi:MAG: hypothetical protein AAGN35_13920 [Bacteroidota bacterium]